MKQKETAAVLMVLLAAACWGANGIFINILTAYGVNGTAELADAIQTVKGQNIYLVAVSYTHLTLPTICSV